MKSYQSDYGDSSVGFDADTLQELVQTTNHYVAYYHCVCGYSFPFKLTIADLCPTCKGAGKIAKRGSNILSKPCYTCNGEGRLKEEHAVINELPAIDESLLSAEIAPVSSRYVSTPMLVQVLYPSAVGDEFIGHYEALTHSSNALQSAWDAANVDQRRLILRLSGITVNVSL